MAKVTAYAYLNAKVMPMDRGERFEDPLDEALSARDLGEVVGGGTLQAEDGEIVHCGIDLELDGTQETLAFVRDFLTRCGAPHGSKLQYDRAGTAVEEPFGQVEGVAVYLNGTDLPDEVYQASDVNVVIETFEQLTAASLRYLSYWQGPRETAIYLYGTAASHIEEAIAPFLASYPLCQRARVVRIA